MNSFSVDLPNERAKAYRLITLIILILNFFVFGFVFFNTEVENSLAMTVLGMVINAIPLIFFLLNKKHIRSPWLEISFFISAALTLMQGNYIAAISLVLFSLFGFFANRKRTIIVNDSGVVYPSFPEKLYAWTEIAQVIWKDDILTLDLRNNRLMQLKIERQVADKFPVGEFNAYCRQKLSL